MNGQIHCGVSGDNLSYYCAKGNPFPEKLNVSKSIEAQSSKWSLLNCYRVYVEMFKWLTPNKYHFIPVYSHCEIFASTEEKLIENLFCLVLLIVSTCDEILMKRKLKIRNSSESSIPQKNKEAPEPPEEYTLIWGSLDPPLLKSESGPSEARNEFAILSKDSLKSSHHVTLSFQML